MANLIDAGGSGGAYARSVVAQARAAILPEVRRLIDESIGRIAVRAGGNLAAIGIRSALMFDPAATAVVDDPDHEQVIVPLSVGGAFVGCDAYDTGVTGYVITSGTHFAMPLDGEDFDTSSMHDLVTNTTRSTAPADGYYHCAAQFMFSTFDTPGSGTYWPLHLWLYKNGNPVRQHVDYVIDGHFTMLHVEGTLQLVAGDYVELVVQQTTGGRLQPEQGSAARAARLTVVQVG
jgi:hypothetical protein